MRKPTVQRELAKALKESDVTLKRACQDVGDGLGSERENVKLQAAGMTFKLFDAFPKQRVRDHRHAHVHFSILQGLEELPEG